MSVSLHWNVVKLNSGASLALAAGLALSSCQAPPAPAPPKPFDLQASAAEILHYADALKGLTLEEVEDKLDGAQFRESAWPEGGPTGQLLVAAYPDFVFRLYLIDGKVLVSSFQVLTK
jgi:hypothetical protein